MSRRRARRRRRCGEMVPALALAAPKRCTVRVICAGNARVVDELRACGVLDLFLRE